MAEQFDVVVIGGGPGGYVAAIRAAQQKWIVFRDASLAATRAASEAYESFRSAQTCPPVVESISCAVTRTRLPAWRTLPSST